MASCHKCGKHLKRRKGKAKCPHCGPLPSAPVNPWGSCFDAAAFQMLGLNNPLLVNVVLCHGIGIANKPGEEGVKIAHAWIEADNQQHGRVAIDPLWLVAQSADHYRNSLRVELCVTYTLSDLLRLWDEHDYPGPWDARIKAHTIEGKSDAVQNQQLAS